MSAAAAEAPEPSGDAFVAAVLGCAALEVEGAAFSAVPEADVAGAEAFVAVAFFATPADAVARFEAAFVAVPFLAAPGDAVARFVAVAFSVVPEVSTGAHARSTKNNAPHCFETYRTRAVT